MTPSPTPPIGPSPVEFVALIGYDDPDDIRYLGVRMSDDSIKAVVDEQGYYFGALENGNLTAIDIDISDCNSTPLASTSVPGSSYDTIAAELSWTSCSLDGSNVNGELLLQVGDLSLPLTVTNAMSNMSYSCEISPITPVD